MPRGGRRGTARVPPGKACRYTDSRGTDRQGASSGVGTGQTGFTLQDEARSTARRSSPWISDSSLRHRPIIFVSTGVNEPLKQLEDVLQYDQANNGDEMHKCDPTVSNLEQNASPVDGPAAECGDVQSQYITNEDGLRTLAMSTAGDETSTATCVEAGDCHDRAEDQPATQLPAPPPFVLDVTGDRHPHHSRLPFRNGPRSPSPTASDSSEEVILFKGRDKATRHRTQLLKFGGALTETKCMGEIGKPSAHSRISPAANNDFILTRQSRQTRKTQKHQEENDVLADYNTNMRDHDDGELTNAHEHFRRDLGGSISKVRSMYGSFQTAAAPIGPEPSLSREIELDATKGVFGASNVDSTAGAELNSKKTMLSGVDDKLLTVLETDALYLGSHEQSQAENMSQQSETSDQEVDDLFTTAADKYANEFENFDFMNWDRMALQRKQCKGARGKAPVLDVSDSELESGMRAAWQNNRLKKAERKRERQALRAQGLLGKHANPQDLRFKYPHGMGLDQIAEELRIFLVGSQASMTLPPMDNHARKIIHELASKFNIKSKSTGSGDQRRPMLHRTFKTAKFAEEPFDLAIARVGRKHFPRNDTALRAVFHRQSTRQSGHAGVHYRDGEIVGGSAPELSQENKGRAMLEKMGWSSGTALGALDNKGILQPVVHVVKRSKAGLG